MIRRYHLQKREDYHKYNKLIGAIKKLANRISLLDAKDPFRAKQEELLLEKLYMMGLITTNKKFSQINEMKLILSTYIRK